MAEPTLEARYERVHKWYEGLLGEADQDWIVDTIGTWPGSLVRGALREMDEVKSILDRIEPSWLRARGIETILPSWLRARNRITAILARHEEIMREAGQ